MRCQSRGQPFRHRSGQIDWFGHCFGGLNSPASHVITSMRNLRRQLSAELAGFSLHPPRLRQHVSGAKLTLVLPYNDVRCDLIQRRSLPILQLVQGDAP